MPANGIQMTIILIEWIVFLLIFNNTHFKSSFKAHYGIIKRIITSIYLVP